MENKIEPNMNTLDKVLTTLNNKPNIFPYMFWDNATSINGKGKTPYEIDTKGEKGYFFSLSKTLLNSLAPRRLLSPLSVNEIKEIQKGCTKGVALLNSHRITPGKMGTNGNNVQGYEYDNSRLKEHLFDEFISSIVEDAQLIREYLPNDDKLGYSIAVVSKPIFTVYDFMASSTKLLV